MSEPETTTAARARPPISYLVLRVLLAVPLCALAVVGGRTLLLSPLPETGVGLVRPVVEWALDWSWGWLPW